MNWQMLVFTCSLMFSVPFSSCASELMEQEAGLSELEKSHQSAKLQYNYDLFNYMSNKELWAKWQADKNAIKELKRVQDTKDDESGQIIVKF